MCLTQLNTTGVALCCALGCSLTASLAGGTPMNTVPKALAHEKNVMVPDLANHTPAVEFDSTGTLLPPQRTLTLSLYAQTARGLSVRTIDSDTKKWTQWIHLGDPSGANRRVMGQADPYNPCGLDTTLVVHDGWTSDHVVYYGYSTDSTIATAMPETSPEHATLDWASDAPGFATATPSQAPVFDPQTTLETDSEDKLTYHIFGTGLVRGEPINSFINYTQMPLIELRRSAPGSQRWIDHGTPPDIQSVSVGPASAADVYHIFLPGSCDPTEKPGANGSKRCTEGVSCCPNGEWQCNGSSGENTCQPSPHFSESHPDRYVFVSTEPRWNSYGGYVNGAEVWYLHSNHGTQWSWRTLGSPNGNPVYGAPTVAQYYSALPAAGGRGKLAVFVTAYDEDTNDWALYVQHHDGSGWRSWQKHGAPPDIDGKFRMTTSTTWYEGQSMDLNALRIEVFGTSEPTEDKPGQLVHYRWTGSTWQWQPTRSTPDGGSFRTSHSAAIHSKSYHRVSVFGRSATGRIYELFNTANSYYPGNWRWYNLSWETPNLQIPIDYVE